MIVVVGAGIVGAAIACEIARRGAAVTLLDASLPGHGATGASFAWIGVHGEVPGAAAVLHAGALDAYRTLEAEVAGVRVRWTGSLAWPVPDRPPPVSVGSPQPGGAGDVLEVDAAGAAHIEPNLRRPPSRAVHTTSDAAVDPVAVTEALVQAAREHGCMVRLGVSAVRLDTADGHLTEVATSDGTVPADSVVIAAGVGVRRLCSPLGFDVPVASSPALLMRLDGPTNLVQTLVANSDLEVRGS